MRIRYLLVPVFLAPFLNARAQAPAPKHPAPTDDQPALSTSSGTIPASPQASAPARPSAPAHSANGGTTIIGERESPIGLYITPWRNAAPEADVDRPARLLTVGLEPLDRQVFSRQVEYFEKLTEAQKAKTPAAAPSTPPPQP